MMNNDGNYIQIRLREVTKTETHQTSMGIYYGRISAIAHRIDTFGNDEDKRETVLTCNNCGQEFNRICSMKAHYTWQNDINNNYN